MNKNSRSVQNIFFEIRVYFEISVFEMLRDDCT